jgi:hypothetical protein
MTRAGDWGGGGDESCCVTLCSVVLMLLENSYWPCQAAKLGGHDRCADCPVRCLPLDSAYNPGTVVRYSGAPVHISL